VRRRCDRKNAWRDHDICMREAVMHSASWGMVEERRTFFLGAAAFLALGAAACGAGRGARVG
jgi:hypothetical protein